MPADSREAFHLHPGAESGQNRVAAGAECVPPKYY